MRSKHGGKDRNYTEEECARKGDLVEDLLDVIRSGSTLSDTGDGTAVLLKIVCNLDRIEGDLSIEVCKEGCWP